MTLDIQKIQSSADKTIEDVIKDINASGAQFAIIVELKKVIGLVTDGDIRRLILEKVDINSNIKKILNPSFAYLIGTPSLKECKSFMQKKEITFLPILNSNMHLKNIIVLKDLLEDFSTQTKEQPPIFILAGGFGKRMAPLTDNVPKPMLKVGGIPLLEIIIERFRQQGFRDYFIATHYLSEQIKEYFLSGANKNIHINYLYEENPLGTAGSLSLLDDSYKFKNIIVVNGDLLNKVDYNALYKFHISQGAAITMATKMYRHEIPYGVARYEESRLIKIDEKPKVNFQVNAGIYVISKRVIQKFISNVEYLDMPNLINELISKKEAVSVFPIYEYWNDIGARKDFDQAQIDFANEFEH